jgi:ATP-dependent Clp protease protease subunit
MVFATKQMRRVLKLHKNVRHDYSLVLPEIIVVNDFHEEGLRKFHESFNKAVDSNQDIIPIVIDSYGGDVHALLGMISIIKTSSVPVATIVEAKAMSAGVILFASGTKGFRFISPLAHLMIHEVSTEEEGKLTDMKVSMEHAELLNAQILSLLDGACGKKKGFFVSEVSRRKNADWYVSPLEAKRLGLADHIQTPSLQVTVEQQVSLL